MKKNANFLNKKLILLYNINITVKIWFGDGHTDTIYFKGQDDLARRMPEFMLKTPGGVKKTKLISKN